MKRPLLSLVATAIAVRLISALSLMVLTWLSASQRRHGVAVGFLLCTIPLALLATAIA